MPPSKGEGNTPLATCVPLRFSLPQSALLVHNTGFARIEAGRVVPALSGAERHD
jgi:hypothetical protein